uniref:Uncharacterized protein n=1 Tax=Kwoniella dejecticola CBS 10117 TaxID=1296121 RepID=A0A1A6AF07_9TREE|nr:uncharacterized protein I303_00472 [Kwoniella dejecticola CBS 10117]OBR88655.1 hypothetical protein I303_00472 [Kwoniella dejecticola CBS 10117]
MASAMGDPLQAEECETTQVSMHESIPEALIQQLSARSETGGDNFDRIHDPFLSSINKPKAYIVARQYTRDATIVQPSSEMLGEHLDLEVQLEKLSEIIRAREEGSCIWINVLGVASVAIQGMAELCGLSLNTFTDHKQLSEHRHHRSHVEVHPTYTYIQLLIQDTLKPLNTTPILDIVKDLWTPPSSNALDALQQSNADKRLSSKSSRDKALPIEKMCRPGFISIFIVPSTKMDMTLPGQLDIGCNGELLGLSMVHRRYASGIMRNVDKRIRIWDDRIRNDFSAIDVNEIHRLITNLNDFLKRFKALNRVHKKLRAHQHSINTSSEQRADESAAIAQKSRRYMDTMLDQGEETICRVSEEVDGHIDRLRYLESFYFSVLSTRANASMERLAIVTIVFLPLTFIYPITADPAAMSIITVITQGFEDFPDLRERPSYFWEIATPLSVAFFVIFAYASLQRGLSLASKTAGSFLPWWRGKSKWWITDIVIWYRLTFTNRVKVKQRSNGPHRGSAGV